MPTIVDRDRPTIVHLASVSDEWAYSECQGHVVLAGTVAWETRVRPDGDESQVTCAMCRKAMAARKPRVQFDDLEECERYWLHTPDMVEPLEVWFAEACQRRYWWFWMCFEGVFEQVPFLPHQIRRIERREA